MPPTSRAHGGQPGNSNALKHGFYARSIDLSDLDAVRANLVDEITAARVMPAMPYSYGNSQRTCKFGLIKSNICARFRVSKRRKWKTQRKSQNY